MVKKILIFIVIFYIVFTCSVEFKKNSVSANRYILDNTHLLNNILRELQDVNTKLDRIIQLVHHRK